MDEEKKVTLEAEEMSEESRRDFVNKLLAGVGGVAAAGLLASALGSPAEAAPIGGTKMNDGGITALAGTPLRYQALSNGHSFSASSERMRRSSSSPSASSISTGRLS